MSFVAVSAGVAAVSAGYSIYNGEKQKSDAKKLAADNTLAPYEIPGQVREATSIAERTFLNGMPGVESAKGDISRAGANAFSQAKDAATSSNDLLDSIAKIQLMENNAFSDLAEQSSLFKLKAGDAYQDALMREAQYEDKSYQKNEEDPYLRKANAAAAMYGAGQTNIGNGINGLSNVGLGLTYNLGNKSALDAFEYPQQNPIGGPISKYSLNPMKSSSVNLNMEMKSATEAAAAILRNYKF